VTNVEKPVREFLSSWWFWVGVAYFGLACVVVALYFINGRTSRAAAHVARDEAVHQSEIAAGRQAALTQCLASRPELRKINGFVGSVQLIRDALESNNRAVLEETPATSPAYTVRAANLQRIRATARQIEAVHFTVPTVAQCKERGGVKTGTSTKEKP
jgi:hypothetical protein